MIFGRTPIHSEYSPYSVYFRMAVVFRPTSSGEEGTSQKWTGAALGYTGVSKGVSKKQRPLLLESILGAPFRESPTSIG